LSRRRPQSDKCGRVPVKRSGDPSGLDIGCGTGVSSEALIKFCSRLVGIDPSRAMLAQANNIEGLSVSVHQAPIDRKNVTLRT
uniref:methyltransferase domain-containing protein n=1 Tax=uncultured Vibrio sp. TaxID=114054 RepID=UPI00260FC5BF